MPFAIEAEAVWKRYRYGVIGYGTLRRDLQSWWAKWRGRDDPNLAIDESGGGGQEARATRDEFWALRDVSFQIKPGEVVGVIGRNGAGKSTLLKIMSRVTSPTRGIVRLRGRVASLLEVGTGFHPDLSGRDNIFLNGAILGMSRAEVRRKFDAIVSFAELERFVETPVKRYSSGMYVRLAFAVAAHLEPEILLVDEVLAVGDADFQAKCLGKMEEVSRAGRTILFVSHNLQAVQSLCPRAIHLSAGGVVQDGPAEDVIDEYLKSMSRAGREAEWSSPSGLGNATVRLKRLAVRHAESTPLAEAGHGLHLRTDKRIAIEMGISLERVSSGLCIGFDLVRPGGTVVLRSYQTDPAPESGPKLHQGDNSLRCVLPAGLLNGGEYLVSPRIGIHNKEWIVHEDALLAFRTVLSHGVSPYWNSLNEHSRPGHISPILLWEAPNNGTEEARSS